MKQQHQTNILSENRYFKHLLKHQKIYLLLLLIFLLSIPLLTNIMQDNPIIRGEESYYYLSTATEFHFFHPLSTLFYILNITSNSRSIIFYPFILAILSLLLFYKIAQKIQLSAYFTFFFLLLLLLSPAFIYVYSTLSAYSLFIFLLLCGLYLLTKENNWPYFSLIPLALASFFDLFLSLILVSLLLILIRKKKKKEQFIILSFIIFFILINICFLNQQFILGPFQEQGGLINLVSDLGSSSGISIFTLLAAFIGFTLLWKKKEFNLFYLYLIFLLIIYYFNPHVLFPLIIVMVFFAAMSITKIFEIQWELNTLKKFTLLLLILGIIFSSISYFERMTPNTPTNNDFEALLWIKDNSAAKDVVFSSPQNSYYINYISKQKPFYFPHHPDAQKERITQAILSSEYIDQLIPLLSENNITLLYFTPQIKQQLSKEYGLLFLLKNEKFKLVHSREGTEVWVFSHDN